MKILFAADLSFFEFDHYEAGKAAACMKDTAEVFRNADFSMLNLENIFGEKEKETPIVKTGPNLISSAEFAEYIHVLRPAVIGLANNHSGDWGEGPMMATIGLLKKAGYCCIGAGRNIREAYEPALLEKDGVKAAIIAVCENEFGVAGETYAGTAGYSLSRVSEAIRSALGKGYQPILYFHGGNEHNPFPSPGKTELYRHFIDMGAKAVIAMHTHCPQGYEWYRGCPIVYSMGNFFFPKNPVPKQSWNVGYMAELTMGTDGMELSVVPYRFDFDRHTLLEGEEKEAFLNYLAYISKPLSDGTLIQEYFDSWSVMSGLHGYAKYLQYTEHTPADGAEGVKCMRNNFTCEAHNELLKNALELIYRGKVEEAGGRIEEIRALQQMKLPEGIS